MGTDVPLCLCSPAKRQLLFQGGVIAFPINKTDEFRTAIADFSANSQDPKAAIIPTYASGQVINAIIFYDAPTAPPGTFDCFTNIPSVFSDLKTRSYPDLILSFNVSYSAGFR
jgi:hypothetical protein